MSGPLVSVDEFVSRLNDPTWSVLDCRFDLSDVAAGYAGYLEGHIPGARFVDLERNMAGTKTGRNGRHPLPDRAELSSFFRETGIGLDTKILAYDAGDNRYAARLWWLARWLGHANVAVLDGGMNAWTAAGLQLEKSIFMLTKQGTFKTRPSLVGMVEIEVVANKEEHGLLVLDARAAPRYRGEVEPLDRIPGHIPGALNRPYTDNLDADGRFLAPEKLLDAFTAIIGSHPPEKVVSQCGSGVTACHNLLAMEVAGMKCGLLYPGSWSEWSSDPARPVAVGPDA